jgi:glycosyltransferase involved in cell wall biosynthesis
VERILLMPIVSVIIPSYNRADMLPDAIQSVLDQSLKDWELIIVDDGSTDQTRTVAARYTSTDDRIQYIYQDNRKLPGARNTGIRASRGRYIAFLDSDDVFLPEKLKIQAATLDERPELGLIAGGFFEVDRDLHILRELRPWESQPTLELRDWVLSCPFCPGAPLIRRNWLEKAEFFDEKMPFVEDWDLWLRMSVLGCPMDWTRQAVCYYRIHGGNMVRQAVLMKNGMLTMFDKLYGGAESDLRGEILDLKQEAYSNAYVNGAARAFGGGDGAEGQACLEKAIEVNPALLQGNPPQVLSRLASFALTPLCGDAEGFIQTLSAYLPGALRGWSPDRLRGTLHAVAAFEADKLGENKEVVRYGIQAVKEDPRWIQNRGFVKMIFQAFAKK